MALAVNFIRLFCSGCFLRMLLKVRFHKRFRYDEPNGCGDDFDSEFVGIDHFAVDRNRELIFGRFAFYHFSAAVSYVLCKPRIVELFSFLI